MAHLPFHNALGAPLNSTAMDHVEEKKLKMMQTAVGLTIQIDVLFISSFYLHTTN